MPLTLIKRRNNIVWPEGYDQSVQIILPLFITQVILGLYAITC